MGRVVFHLSETRARVNATLVGRVKAYMLFVINLMNDLNSLQLFFQSESMQKDLFIMERAIALNIYQPRQARYRGLDVVPGKSRYVISLIVKRNQNIPIWRIFFVLLQASDKGKIQIPHKESNLRPLDSALPCCTTELQRSLL